MNQNERAMLTTLTHPRSPIAEAYRGLRTNLDFSSLDRPLRTMIVTSAAPEEGKSTTLANLAVTLAQAGKRVILVDADLRRPVQHKLFGLRETPGLTSLVIDPDAVVDQMLQPAGVTNLHLLPSGPLPPNPSELLGSRRMAEIIAGLAGLSDVVLFDAPPVIAVTDAAVLASRVDGVLLVIYAGKTKREHVDKARALLDRVNAHVVGAVLTNVRPDTSLQYYYTTPEQG